MFSLSISTAKSPQVATTGEVSSAFGSFSIQARANDANGVSQGVPATPRVSEPGLAKGAPIPSLWEWMKARPAAVAVGILAIVGLIWLAKRKG